MTVMTTNDENRYQQAQIDPKFAAECMERAIEIARQRRQIAQAAGYVYHSNR